MSFRHPLANVLLAVLLIIMTTLPAARLVAAVTVDGEVRPIALSGRPAAGVPGATYSSIVGESAAVNDHDQVVFEAYLSGSGVTDSNRFGLWLGDSLLSQSLIARTGNQPPGLPSTMHFAESFEPPTLNNRGEVTFTPCIVPVENPNKSGAWTTAGGPLRLLVAEEYPMPNYPGTPTATSAWYTAINNSSQSVFGASVSGSSSLFVDTPGQTLRRVVSTGDALPGDFSPLAIGLQSPHIADNGRISFRGYVSSTSGNYYGLWSETGGTMKQIVREGMAAVGTPGTINSIYNESMSPNGLLTFDTFVTVSTYIRNLYAQRTNGSLRLVASTLGTVPGSTFTLTNLYASNINTLGQVAFQADISGYASNPRPNSLWFEDSSGLHLLTRGGQPAPGTAGAVFDGFEHIQYNDNGDLMFEAFLTHGIGGVTDANDSGIWVRSRTGQLSLIARAGDYIDLAPGAATDLRHMQYVDSIGLYGGLGKERRTLTNNGEVLFSAYFDDGSTGLFLTQPIPEPTSLGIALVLTLAAASSSRRTRK